MELYRPFYQYFIYEHVNVSQTADDKLLLET